MHDGWWRIGHFPRDLPAGYLESVGSGSNRIEDPAVRALYVDLVLATQAPLLDRRRLAAIWRLNTGHHSPLLRRGPGFGSPRTLMGTL